MCLSFFLNTVFECSVECLKNSYWLLQRYGLLLQMNHLSISKENTNSSNHKKIWLPLGLYIYIVVLIATIDAANTRQSSLIKKRLNILF